MKNTDSNNAANNNNTSRDRSDSKHNARRVVAADPSVAFLATLAPLANDAVSFRLRNEGDGILFVEFIHTKNVDLFDVADDGAAEERISVVYHAMPYSAANAARIADAARRFVRNVTCDAAEYDRMTTKELMAKRAARAPKATTWAHHVAPILRTLGVAC